MTEVFCIAVSYSMILCSMSIVVPSQRHVEVLTAKMA